MTEYYGPLGKAYGFGTTEYKLIYLAVNRMFLSLENDNAVYVHGIKADEVSHTLEKILTDNADPDRE